MRESRAGTETRIAAIDIGSNSVRQIVADVTPDGAISVVDEMKAAPRLGADLEDTGVLGANAIERAVEAIARMATLARQLGANRIETVATSAVRDAENAKRFIARVRQETGLRVKVLRGEDEARLSFRSALAHFDLAAGRSVIMDIGGGSLELALSADGVLDELVSGGTFTNLGGMHLARQHMLAARNVHATKIPRTEVEHLLDAMASMSTEERREMPGLNPGRADIIVAGVAVAAEVLARVDARDLVVSRYGIREGILLETARVRATAADPGEARERSVREFAERCHYEAPHAQQVQRLALRLFDALGERLGCSDEDRTLLGDAALLHDVGYHISYDRHHKHAYHLILHAELLGVAPAEQVVMANVARYHRGAEPKRKHRNFGELSPAMRGRVRKLAALLRVADGFDRGHIGAVAELKVRRMKRAIRITPVAQPGADNIRLDIWGAHRKSELLARVAGIPVEIVSPDGDVFSSDAVEAGANE